MKRRLLSVVLLFTVTFAGGAVLLPAAAHAATRANCVESAGGFLSFPTWYKYLDPVFDDASKACNLNLAFPDDIGKVLLAVFEIILRVGSLVAIGYVIYGGIQYIISQGEPERIKNARTTIINAIIGMVITIFASAIVSLIGNSIT
ncbi:hypothetical protein H0X10_02845 [Candidatus Saccharibacteria bacterium]|nr:hypothetical protein [Candidatus Saccharibacteria bacterium]